MSSPSALESPINSNTAYSTPLATSVYAFNASGGFTMERGFDDIKFRDLMLPTQFKFYLTYQLLIPSLV